MEQTGKRTDRKSEGIRKASRVVDMSWAADYLDDAWENDHSAKGAYDTQVLPPLTKYTQTRKTDIDPMSVTQKFKAASAPELMPDRTEELHKDDIAAPDLDADTDDDDLKIVDAVTEKTIATYEEAQQVRSAIEQADQDVRDDLTLPSDQPDPAILTEDTGIIPAIDEEDDDITEELKIRDAVTDQTVASIDDAKAVRRAVMLQGIDEDLDDLGGVRDALSSRKPWSAGWKAPAADQSLNQNNEPLSRNPMKVFPWTPASRSQSVSNFTETQPDQVTEPADTYEEIPQEPAKPKELFFTIEEEPEDRTAPLEEPGKTIVATGEARNIRKAALVQELTSRTGSFNLEDLFREDDSELYADEEENYEPYEEDDEIDGYYDGPAEYSDRFGRYDDHDAPDRMIRDRDYEDYGPGDEWDDGYDDRESRSDRRRRSKDRRSSRRGKTVYYGYAPSKSPLRFIPLVLVIAVCVFGFIAAKQICHDVPLNSSDYSKVKYTVEAGLTNEQLAQDLEGLGIIDNPLVFRLRCLFYSADYVPGTYELSPCYSTEKIINILSGYTYGTEE